MQKKQVINKYMNLKVIMKFEGNKWATCVYTMKTKKVLKIGLLKMSERTECIKIESVFNKLNILCSVSQYLD